MEKDPDEIVRLLRGLRSATLYLLQYPKYRRDVFQRIMRVERVCHDRVGKGQVGVVFIPGELEQIVGSGGVVGTFRLKDKPKNASEQSQFATGASRPRSKSLRYTFRSVFVSFLPLIDIL